MPFQRLVPVLLLAALGAAFLAVASGRLGAGDGADADKVINQAFSGQSLESGRFEATLRASVQGLQGSGSGNVEVEMNGAFQNEPKAKAPKVDIDMTVRGAGAPMQFGVVSTGQEAFVEAGGRSYQVPEREFERTLGASGQRASEQQSAALAALGVDPRSWLVNATDEGTADVGGVETNHVSASVDTDKLVDDIIGLASRTGDSRLAGIPAGQTDQVRDAIEDARIDIYTATSDGTLRKLTAQVTLGAEQGSGNLSFEMELTDVNEPQRITAPADARPFSELEGDLGSGFLSRLQGGASGAGAAGGSSGDAAGGDSGSGSGSASSPGSAGSTGSGGRYAALPEPAQAYLRCVEKAGTSADIQKCAPLLE